jgi:hypothetical protein
MKALVLILGAGLLALGCQKSEPPAPLVASAAPSAAPVASATASAAPTDSAAAVDSAVPLATAAPAAAAAKVPTEADYEVQAQSTITPTNAAQVLTAIEKQVGQ